MKHKLLLSLALAAPVAVVAQTRTVSGRVTSVADGTGLPGTTVLERGTSNGVSTDADGNFRLTVQPGATLVISSIGFATQEVAVGDQSTLNIKLTGSNNLLNETVVVGYGTQTKRELTGAVTQIGSKEVENVPVQSFEQAIQGRTPGVNISQTSGKLGAGVQIRVRGSSSVTASNQPLYVIDGIPVTSQDVGLSNDETVNPLADLNPNDIESITILKDAASSAIYGARASNGVILVTTKKGRQGATRVNFGYYVGTSRATHLREFLNASEYRQLFGEAVTNASLMPDSYINSAYGPNPDVAQVFNDEAGIDYNSPTNTKWSELAYRKGKVTQYDASVTGGDAKTRFFLSGNYNDQTGIIIGNRYRRGSLRVNLDHTISEKFKVGLNLSLVRSVNDRVPDDNAFSNPVQMNALSPLQAAYLPDGTPNPNTFYYNGLIEVANSQRRTGNYRSFSSAYVTFQPIKGVTLRTELGGDFLNLNEDVYLGRKTQDGAPTGYGYSNQSQAVNYTSNNTATWLKTFGSDHTIEALAGFTFQRFDNQQTSAEGRAFPNDLFKKITSAARKTDASTSQTGYSFLSVLSRVNYTFRNKYLVSGSIRGDESSRFGKDKRWGVFPAGSVGWVITEEDFLRENSTVSLLKLRASYGLTGNAEIGNFSSRTLYNGIQYADVPGTVPSTLLGNNLLTWENTKQANVGFEFGFFNDRIAGEVDVYQKQTDKLLSYQPLRYTGGYSQYSNNLGSLRNRGVEFSLNTRNVEAGSFRWTTNLNMSFNRNKITKLNGPELISGSRNLGRVREGEPIGVFWGKKYAGVDPANGDALYYTADGTTTADYSAAANQRLGNPNPKFTGGFTNTVSWKGFEVSLLTQFSYGNDLYNVAGLYQAANADYWDNQTKDQLRRWQEPGDVTDVPQPRLYESNGTNASSRWMEDGSYFRFKNLTVAYTLPKGVVEKARMQSVRVYVTGQNLATITNYTGYDPEVNSTGLNTGAASYLLGHDFYTPALAKTWLVGVNVGF